MDNEEKTEDVAKVVDALGVALTADALSVAEMTDFPRIDGMREKDRAILCLNACGFSQNFIAKAMGMSQPSVWERIEKCDPQRMFTLSQKAKRAFMTRLAESRGLEALAYLTPEKLENAGARELMSIAKDAVSVSQQLNQSKHKEVSSSTLDYMLTKMVEEGSEDA